MPITMVVTRDVESRYRGFLTSVMLDVAPGVDVSPDLSAGVRQRVWDVGSPARAGIDPKTAESASRTPWFPRTRGDRPIMVGCRWVERTVPRTRGDRPYEVLVRAVSPEVPPHTRG